MDPNANLKGQLELAKEILGVWDDCDANGRLTQHQAEHVSDQAEKLAELVIALNNWISRGGFLPRRWKDPQV